MVCSLDIVDKERKFEIPYFSTEEQEEVVAAYDYFAGGAACPLEYTMKE